MKGVINSIMNSLKNNKWIRAAIPALLLHGSIGSVYCWSIFSQEIADHIGYSKGATEWAFSIAIFFLGMSAAFMGNLVERDIHKSTLLSTIFFFLGMRGTSYFIEYGGLHPHSLVSLIGIYISYGVIMGTGLGLGYLSPVKTLMIWFKDRKGLATGLAVAGFGLAKAIASPIMQYIVENIDGGVYKMFSILSIVYLVLMYIGHSMLKKPDEWKEPEKKDTPKLKEILSKKPIRNYIAIWLMFYLNITCGLAIISQEKMIIKCIGLGAYIGVISTISSLFNAGGRIAFASWGDKCGDRNTVYKWIFTFSIIVTLLCNNTHAVELGRESIVCTIFVIVMIMVVNAGYGGGFSVLPSLLSDHYGMGSISTIHGITLSAWAFAGLTGNQLASWIVNKFGEELPMIDSAGNTFMVNPHGYHLVICVVSILYAIAAFISNTVCNTYEDKYYKY